MLKGQSTLISSHANKKVKANPAIKGFGSLGELREEVTEESKTGDFHRGLFDNRG